MQGSVDCDYFRTSSVFQPIVHFGYFISSLKSKKFNALLHQLSIPHRLHLLRHRRRHHRRHRRHLHQCQSVGQQFLCSISEDCHSNYQNIRRLLHTRYHNRRSQHQKRFHQPMPLLLQNNGHEGTTRPGNEAIYHRPRGQLQHQHCLRQAQRLDLILVKLFHPLPIRVMHLISLE